MGGLAHCPKDKVPISMKVKRNRGPASGVREADKTPPTTRDVGSDGSDGVPAVREAALHPSYKTE